MDLKIKGISWVGNIYQKFEAICHEADFVSQDKIKYVENRVHTVGESVKQACSNVVQDLLSSSSVDSGENKAQAFSPVKSIDSAAEIKLTTANEKLYLGAVEKLCAGAILNPDLKSVEELSLPHISGTSESSINVVSSVIESVAEINCKSCELCLTPVNERGSESTKEKSSMDVLSSSDTLEMIDMGKSEGTGAFLSSVIFNYNDERDHDSNERSLLHSGYEGKLSPTKEKSIKEEATPSIMPVAACDCNNDLLPLSESVNDDCLIIHGDVGVSPAASSCLGSESTEKMGGSIISDDNNFSGGTNALLFSESASKVPNESKEEEMGCSASCSSISMGSCNLSDTDLTNSSQNAVDLPDCLLDAYTFGSNCLTVSVFDISAWEENKVGKILAPSCCILSRESKRQFEDTPDVIGTNCMETIELNDEVKLDESCVVVDSCALALSRRVRNPRSYKKIIQDAFASKRRLAKEYEQLAIWYGDIDAEFSQQRVKKPLSCFHVNSSSKNDPNDSDWELL